MSQSTVSLVLSGKGRGRISAKTEEAVRAAAAELGYRPNVAARTLRTGVTRTVGLVVPDITNPFFGPMLRGAQKAAMQAGYTVMLVDIGEDRRWEARSVEALLAGPSDGLLLFETGLPPGAELPAIGIEVVPGTLPVVRLDVTSGFDQVLDHLLGLGHERFAHLAADFDAQTFRLRAERIEQRLRDAGLPAPVTARADITFAAAAAAAAPLLDSGATAFVCDDDIMAGGLYLAARERGVRIPERHLGGRLRRSRVRRRARPAADDRARRRGPTRRDGVPRARRDARRRRAAGRSGAARQARAAGVDARRLKLRLLISSYVVRSYV